MIKTDNKPITHKELERFLNRCIDAGVSCRDGWGVMCEKWSMKNTTQFNKHDVKHIIKNYDGDSRFFCCHVRYATCEIKKEYTHPFHNERFMLVHNGVLEVDNEKSGSDSLDLFNAVHKAFKTDYAKALRDAIKTASGSFSVLSYVYDVNALYYVRNSPAFDFLLCEKENVIYGATDIDRLKPLQKKIFGFFETALESRPLKNMIYKINLSDARFSRCGEVEEKPYIYQAKTTQGTLTDTTKNKYGWRGYEYGYE